MSNMDENKILDSGSRLLNLVRNQMPFQQGIELATVITPPPDLRIRIDNMDLILEPEDLIVCEHLLDHERDYATAPGIAGGTMSVEGYTPHEHTVYTLGIENQKVTISTNLKKNDRVVVQALPGGQQYLVIDKAVMLGD